MFNKTHPLVKLLKAHSGEMLVTKKLIFVYSEGIDSVIVIPKEAGASNRECQELVDRVANDLVNTTI